MSDGPLSPEEVAHRGFGTTFRGFDTGEVRTYLQRVANDLRESTARERDLHRRLADAEHRAAHPVLEGENLSRALGDEMGRILATAQDAANGLKDKAEENAARILREAHDQAQRIRAQAEAILAVRTEEADAEAGEIRRAAQSDAAGVVERATREAAAAMADVGDRARQLVHDAQAARARVLGDLTRRRRLLQTQVEQLRAGRERLLDAYRKVRSTTDEVADELQRVEDEARQAASAAGERPAAGVAVAAGDDLDDVLAAFQEGLAADEPVAAGSEGATEGESGAEAEPGGDAWAVRAGDALVAVGHSGTAPAGTAVPFEVKAEVAAQLAAQAADSAESQAIEAEAAEVQVAGQAAAAAPPPHVVSTRPGGPVERRPLRLLRRARPEGRPLDLITPPSGEEAVRVIPPGPPAAPSAADEGAATAPGGNPAPPAPDGTEAATASPSSAPVLAAVPHAAADEPAVAAAPAPAASSDKAGPSDEPAVAAAPAVPGSADSTSVAGEAEAAAAVAGVDELFARIRAGRADAVARAHEVLATDPGVPVQLHGGPPSGPGLAATGADTPAAADPHGGEEALLRRRDTAVEGIEPRLARKLKRALQDEQNEVLDRLRSAKAGAGPDAVLPALDDQAGRYRLAADDLLRSSAAAGVAFVARDEQDTTQLPDVANLVAELAASVADPLRRALERALAGDGSDQSAVAERIGAAYRECKGQRIEGLAGDAVAAAFARGTLSAMPAGASSQWVVDDDGRPCPDCDDNALAGPTPAGEEFPTGQKHPPAHAGCRCVLAPAGVAPAVHGTG